MINNNEIATKVKAYLNDKGKIQISIDKTIDFIFNKKLEQLLPDIGDIPERDFFKFIEKKDNLVKIMMEIELKTAYPHTSIANSMNSSTEISIAEFINAMEIKPSRKLLVSLMQQKAIQDILSNIIECAIIEFNKKLNPFFGAIQATGLDKQIKNFINLFLPSFLPKIADFVYDTTFNVESSNVGKDLSMIVMNAPLSELQFPDEHGVRYAEQKLSKLRKELIEDKKFQASIRQFHLNIRTRFLAKYGQNNLIEFLQISFEDYNSFKKEAANFISTQIHNYNIKNPVEDIVSEIISDILA